MRNGRLVYDISNRRGRRRLRQAVYELTLAAWKNAAARVEDDTPPDGAIDEGNLNAKRATIDPLGVAVEDDEEAACASWRRPLFAYG